MNEGMKMEGPNTNLGINNQNGNLSAAAGTALSAGAEQGKFVKTIDQVARGGGFDVAHALCLSTPKFKF